MGPSKNLCQKNGIALFARVYTDLLSISKFGNKKSKFGKKKSKFGSPKIFGKKKRYLGPPKNLGRKGANLGRKNNYALNLCTCVVLEERANRTFIQPNGIASFCLQTIKQIKFRSNSITHRIYYISKFS